MHRLMGVQDRDFRTENLFRNIVGIMLTYGKAYVIIFMEAII